DTSDGGKWIKAGYREEKNNIKDSNKKSNGYTIKLIRILKKWISNRNINLKSFHIELLVVKFIEENELSDTYPYILKDFFEFLINMKNNNLIMPGTNEIIPLGDFWFGKTEIDLGRIKKAIDYESNQKNKSAYKEWNKLFGDDFPLLGVKNEELSDSEKCEIKKLTKLYPTPDEEFITDQFTVELNDDYQFEIDAKVNMPGFLRGYLSDFLKRGLLKLEREKEIKFEIKTNTVPLPYIIKWKVRNFGDQARKTSQLRGKILDDGGEEIRTEITRYTGTHYVECFVIKDNICVAKSIIFVPIE
ncbi:MAG: hypothetical protein OEL89_03115, partial [Candidatus Peregrinibacteria bacterium]|nr:hypothetical protein [Candidatus Peregrinibacteria bacterium]